MTNRFTVAFATIFIALLALPLPAAAQERFGLAILHTNDVHSRLLPINKFDAPCAPADAEKRECFGGVARLAAKAAAVRAEIAARGGHALLLDGGDQFQGTLFYSQYRGKAELEAMNAIGYDAMAIGNHEFDDGPKALAEFIRGARFPVLSANIDASREPLLADLVKPSVVLERGGRRIGIVGLTTTDTPVISSPGPNVVFHPPAEIMRAAVAQLTAQGIDIIIAVTHIGLFADRALARAVDGVDIIVGGHSHTPLSNTAPGAEGPYPVVERSPSGQPVLIVQAGSYTRFLGRLEVAFDAAGKPASWSGDAIVLDMNIDEDPTVAALVARLGEPLEQLRREVVGEASEPVDQTRCREAECQMGNLVSEALLWAMRGEGAEIAIQNGGGLRASFGAGPITLDAVLTVLPFQNTIATLGLKGSDVVAALENGLSQAERGAGRFPQVAGLRYVWERARPAGQRVVSVAVRQADGSFAALDPDRVYKVVTNNFMRRGGDGYTVFRDRGIEAYDFGPNIEKALMDYLAAHGPLRVALDGRIEGR